MIDSSVRPANRDDGQRIAEILQSCFDRDLLEYTIYISDNLNDYLRDTIALRGLGENSYYFVYENEDEIKGFAEFRSDAETVFLNNIFIMPEYRSIGGGSELLKIGLCELSYTGQKFVALDVFSNNAAARRWYSALGFKPVFRQVWAQFSLPKMDAGGWWSASGLPQADRVHDAYGFSSFSLQTDSSTYSIGRLGESLFRISSPEIFDDYSALRALNAIGPSRSLLYIGREEQISKRTVHATHLATSLRLKSNYEEILRNLNLHEKDAKG